MDTTLTFLDGINTIGGTKIHLLADDVGIFLDFGLNFKNYSLYFEEFLKPRSSRGIYDFIALDLVPPLENIYRRDIFPPDLKIDSGLKLQVDAVFLSHAHMDHSGNIGLLDFSIPLYCSSMTAVICKALQDTGTSSFENEVIYSTPRECTKTDPLAITTPRGMPCVVRPVYLVDKNITDELKDFWGKSFSNKKLEVDYPRRAEGEIKNLSFKAFMVDHSIFGATSFAFKTSSGWIAYTGDFRLHGFKKELTESCIKSLKDLHLKALIVEGTNIDEVKRSTEEEVFENCFNKVKDNKGKLVIADFSPRNIERLVTFLKISKEIERKLVITSKDAFLLYSMRLADKEIPDVLAHPNLFIFDEIKSSLKLWERDFVRKKYESKYVTASEVGKSQGDFILAFSFWDLTKILDIKPSGGIYIYSTSEAFTEEQEIDVKRLKNWLDHFGIEPVGFKIKDGEIKFLPGYHASGHISGEELIEVIGEIEPEILIPVHTENPESFVKYFGNKMKVIIPEERKPIKL